MLYEQETLSHESAEKQRTERGRKTKSVFLILSRFVLPLLVTIEKFTLLLAIWCYSQQLSVDGAVKQTSFMCSVG